MKPMYSLSILLTSTLISIAGPVAADNRDVVTDGRGQIIRNTFGNCVRTGWLNTSDACGVQARQPVAVPPQVDRSVIGKEERTVYFDFDKSNIRPDATQRLNTLAESLKANSQIKEARVFGYADRIGSPQYNEKLSMKRAQAVKDYLTSRGFVNSRVTETRWFGESSPATTCASDLKRPQLIACLQPDRRVEVEIDYLSQQR